MNYKTFVCPADRVDEQLKQYKGYSIHSITYVGKMDVLVVLEKATTKAAKG